MYAVYIIYTSISFQASIQNVSHNSSELKTDPVSDETRLVTKRNTVLSKAIKCKSKIPSGKWAYSHEFSEKRHRSCQFVK